MFTQNELSRARKEEIIVEAVRNLMIKTEDNWANLAQVGAEIRAKGLKYGKLLPFLQAFSHILEFQDDYELEKPVSYVRLKK